MRGLRKRMTEQPFVCIIMGVTFMAIALGICVVAQTVNNGVERIRVSTGVHFWPSEPPLRFKWDFLYGMPWIGLASGCCAGALLGLWLRHRIKRQHDWWISEALRHIVGMRTKPSLREFLWLIPFFVAAALPPGLIAYFLHVSGAIYGNASVAFLHFVLYPYRRHLHGEVMDALAEKVWTDDERKRAEQWTAKEARSIMRVSVWTAFVLLVVVVGTVAYSQYHERALLNAERIISERELPEKGTLTPSPTPQSP